MFGVGTEPDRGSATRAVARWTGTRNRARPRGTEEHRLQPCEVMRAPDTLRSPMIRPIKRSVLSPLTGERHLDLAEEFKLEVRRSVVKPDLLDLLVQADPVSIERVVGELNRAELEEVWRADGLDDSGNVKQAIAERILAEVDGDNEPATASDAASGGSPVSSPSYPDADLGMSQADDAGWTAPSIEPPKRAPATVGADARVHDPHPKRRRTREQANRARRLVRADEPARSPEPRWPGQESEEGKSQCLSTFTSRTPGLRPR
jgi:hypothetical protein